jgi:hypothetical protein
MHQMHNTLLPKQEHRCLLPICWTTALVSFIYLALLQMADPMEILIPPPKMETSALCSELYPAEADLSVVVGYYQSPYASPDYSEAAIRYRMQVQMGCLAYISSLAPNITVEVVIAHWNSTLTASTLAKWVDQFKRSNLRWVRLIQVAPEAASSNQVPCLRTEQGPQKLACNEYITKNVAARHAKGKFIAIVNVDVVLPKELMNFLSTELDHHTLYVAANRIDLNESVPIFSSEPELMYAKAEQLLKGSTRQCPHCSGDFMMLSRKLLWKSKGYPEVGTEFHIEGQYMNRIGKVGGRIKTAPFAIIHQYHGRRSDRIVANPGTVADLAREYYNSIRSENWGLGNATNPGFIQHNFFDRGENLCQVRRAHGLEKKNTTIPIS